MTAEEQRRGHAYILSSPSRAESCRMAEQLAEAFLCETGAAVPCGICRSCRKVKQGIHPDLVFVRRLTDEKGKLKKKIQVDQIREISRDAWVLPNEAARKVYLIEEADLMNPEAQNAALKLLEEPPNDAVFLLCTVNPSLLLPTVRSRCVLRSAGGEALAPDEESARLVNAFLRAAASGDRAALLRWCMKQDELDQKDTQDFIDALRLALTDMLCARRSDLGLSRRQLAELSGLAARCGDYLQCNVSGKHIFGLLAVDTPLGGTNTQEQRTKH